MGSFFDVDSVSGEDGFLEVCSNDNFWCPKGFHYVPALGLCVFDQASCYNPDSVLFPDFCNFVELVGDFQNPSWLGDQSSCSNYQPGPFNPVSSCCYAGNFSGNIYQFERPVCVYEAGMNPAEPPDSWLGTPEEWISNCLE